MSLFDALIQGIAGAVAPQTQPHGAPQPPTMVSETQAAVSEWARAMLPNLARTVTGVTLLQQPCGILEVDEHNVAYQCGYTARQVCGVCRGYVCLQHGFVNSYGEAVCFSCTRFAAETRLKGVQPTQVHEVRPSAGAPSPFHPPTAEDVRNREAGGTSRQHYRPAQPPQSAQQHAQAQARAQSRARAEQQARQQPPSPATARKVDKRVMGATPAERELWARAVLNVSPLATEVEVRRAAKLAHRDLHPDKGRTDEERAILRAKFETVTVAVEYLSEFVWSTR